MGDIFRSALFPSRSYFSRQAVEHSGGKVSEYSPIFLVDATVGNTVDAFIVDDVDDSMLIAADQAWIPILLQAAVDEHARGIRPAAHSHWRWLNKTGTNRAGRRILAIECGGKAQALIALCLDKKCRLPEQAGLPLVYVDFLETAPWNMKRYTSQPQFRGCGPRLINAAVEISHSLGWSGRLGLHSLGELETLQFYRRVCGMTEMPPDPAYYSLSYFEMTEAQAKAFEEGGVRSI